MATMASLMAPQRRPFGMLQNGMDRQALAGRALTPGASQAYLTDTDPMSGQQWSTDAANQVDPYVLAHNPNATPAMMALAQQKVPNGLPSDGMDMSNVNQANPTQIHQDPAHYGLIGDPSYQAPGSYVAPAWNSSQTPPPGQNIQSGYGPTGDPATGYLGGPGGMETGTGGGPGDSNVNLPGTSGAGPGSPIGSTPNATGGFTTTNPYDVSNYLDPSMAFTMANGLRSLNSNQAASGQLSSGNSLKDILGYSQGLASTNYNNAVGQAQNDRNFGYNVALNDQTIPFNQQLQLAQLGMQGAGGTANQNNLDATLQAQLAMALGQAQGTGTIGGANTINSTISQLINYLNQNKALGTATTQTTPPGG